MLEDVLVLSIVAVTTLLAYAVGRKMFGRSARSLAQAWAQLMECVGAFCLFLSVNMVIGVAVILILRATTPRFISMYILDDVMLIILSAVQGLAFRLWWRSE